MITVVGLVFQHHQIDGWQPGILGEMGSDEGTDDVDEKSILTQPGEIKAEVLDDIPSASQHHTLKYHLLGPSLTKAGQDAVDQKKVSEIIYEASKGSKFFHNEEVKDQNLTVKIDRILKLKGQLEKVDLKSDLRRADEYIASLELSRDLTQYVVHIDCDAFYAAVEELDRPELRDVPMAVGKGVLTTCNYHARKFGCRSGMASFVARKLCPQLICLSMNFDKYTSKAKEVRAVLSEYDPRFESASIDEAYLNIPTYCESHDIDPEEAVAQLRWEVYEKCKITISAGIAPNAKIAKIASNKNKPNGQFRVPNDRAAVMAFMDKLPTRKVNGIGRVFERELDAIGVKTCGDIYDHRAYLVRLFGEKAFEFLLQTYLGLGRTNVRPAEEYERKSVATESTFRDMSSKAELREKLRHTAEELEGDLKRTSSKGRTLVLKVKLHTYEVLTTQVAPPKAISSADDPYKYSLPMLVKLEKENPNMTLRLLGLRCTHLISTEKPDVDKFFGANTTSRIATTESRKEEGEWEVWPEEEFEEAARQERQDEMDQLEQLSQGFDNDADFHEPYGRYKHGNLPNPAPLAPTEPKDGNEVWQCPICGKPQPADDRHFNDHIDFCLSKDTIKTVVAVSDMKSKQSPNVEADQPRNTLIPAVNKGQGVTSRGKRKVSGSASTSTADRRQKRLFFT